MFSRGFQHLRNIFPRICPYFGILYFNVVAVFIVPISIILILYLLFTQHFVILLLYFSWCFYDRNVFNKGGRPWKAYRRWKVWKYVQEYLSVKLVKTAELPPTKNYLLCYHPHGIIPMGAFLHFGTDVTNISQEYPGIVFRFLTLDMLQRFPIVREKVIPFGWCAANKEGIEWLLTKEGTGNALLLVVGGAEELYEARPGTANIILKNRKGFVKLALKHGVPLVPVFGFGENDLYRQVPNPKGSRFRKFQEKCKKLFRFPVPIPYGDRFWLLPFKKQVTVVVGEPIHLEKIPEPTEEDINTTHQIYIDKLTELFEKHKAKYDPDLCLNIM